MDEKHLGVQVVQNVQNNLYYLVRWSNKNGQERVLSRILVGSMSELHSIVHSTIARSEVTVGEKRKQQNLEVEKNSK